MLGLTGVRFLLAPRIVEVAHNIGHEPVIVHHASTVEKIAKAMNEMKNHAILNHALVRKIPCEMVVIKRLWGDRYIRTGPPIPDPERPLTETFFSMKLVTTV